MKVELIFLNFAMIGITHYNINVRHCENKLHYKSITF
jgi:hypothetical protein